MGLHRMAARVDSIRRNGVERRITRLDDLDERLPCSPPVQVGNHAERLKTDIHAATRNEIEPHRGDVVLLHAAQTD